MSKLPSLTSLSSTSLSSTSLSSTSLSSKSQGLFDSVSVLLGLRYTLARQRS
ncbi:MAG: hypothetical protein ACI9NY_001468, partial [Kiritimatiellia bacterium]